MFRLSILFTSIIIILNAQHSPFDEVDYQFTSKNILWETHQLGNDSIKVNIQPL